MLLGWPFVRVLFTSVMHVGHRTNQLATRTVEEPPCASSRRYSGRLLDDHSRAKLLECGVDSVGSRPNDVFEQYGT
jgi:hypothetical protein